MGPVYVGSAENENGEEGSGKLEQPNNDGEGAEEGEYMEGIWARDRVETSHDILRRHVAVGGGGEGRGGGEEENKFNRGP